MCKCFNLYTVVMPTLAEFLIKNGLMVLSIQRPMGYLKQLTNKIIEERKSKNIVSVVDCRQSGPHSSNLFHFLFKKRNDFIQCMIEHADEEGMCKEEKPVSSGTDVKWKHMKKTLSNNEICAHSILFMIAGSQTTADTLSFIAYNLCMHPHYQEQLLAEIDQVLENHVIKENLNLNIKLVLKMLYFRMEIFLMKVFRKCVSWAW